VLERPACLGMLPPGTLQPVTLNFKLSHYLTAPSMPLNPLTELLMRASCTQAAFESPHHPHTFISRKF